ncbi:uncharacterized protein TM35_000201610 [Trypanosoma theileri]|uniref:Amidase domain-containing protein n=1 Tax=Trypanosoma theileri TaxID=67003 RepID=A0A1X0NST2_9TRYP|nr:uncharacterized protein TM35_000201610 [Trypanosoma theileri]ORC87752.1 hypothetical protein TM35_000201610 [Trypanosoma theileri]
MSTMHSGVGVRRAMQRLRYKTSEQRQVVNEMRQHAEELTASGRASAKAKHVIPPPLCFAEVAGEADLQRSFFPDGMLSGVGIGVSDTLDVREFRTRYGVDSQLLHQLPQHEFPFVSWLRRHGAQFVGKLVCRTPVTIGEASLLAADCPAAVAVSRGACNYAISSALMGPAAMTSPLHYDVAAFKPTSQSFATFTDNCGIGAPSMSVGITAARLDDIFYLWEVFTSAIQPTSFLSEEWKETNTGSSGKGGTEHEYQKNHSKTSHTNSTSSTSINNSHNNSSGSSSSSSSSSNNNSGGGGGSGSNSSSNNNNITNTNSGSGVKGLHYGDSSGMNGHGSSSGSSEEMYIRHIELSVGYPADWIDALCQERMVSADEFRRRILRLASTRNAMRKNEVLEVIPLTIDVDLEVVVQAIQTIALYELSQSFDRVFSPTTSSMRGVGGTTSQSGVLDELPDELVSAIFNGRTLTSLDYHRALRARDTVLRATEEQFRDIDLIVAPILSEPYVNSSMRSIAPLLPFALGGNPMVSVQLEPDFPVALIGELGRDTGLFEDCTTFLQFVRGTSPRWWRRKFMR